MVWNRLPGKIGTATPKRKTDMNMMTMKTFPDAFHVFTDGPLSVCLERFGGIDSVKRIDILEKEGKYYPDRIATPVFTKRREVSGRPLYGPSVNFFGETKAGHVWKRLYPADMKVYPFGVESAYYSFFIDSGALLFEFGNRNNSFGNFCASISEYHTGSTELPSLKNQLADPECFWNILCLAPEKCAGDIDPRHPFADGAAHIKAFPLRYDPVRKCLILELHQHFRTGMKMLFAVLRTDAEHTKIVHAPNEWNFYAPEFARRKKIRFVMALGEDLEETSERSARLVKEFSVVRRRKLSLCRKLAERAPSLEIQALPEAAGYWKNMTLYQHFMLLSETSREACIRAAGDKYGFFMFWDQLYPIRDFLLLNRMDIAKKLFRYALGYPYIHTCVWVGVQMVLILHEILSFDGDDELLDEAWPFLCRFLEFSGRFTDEKTGFVLSGLGVGVDRPEEIGLSGLFYPVCVNGWYYGACRVLENMALHRKDSRIAEEARRRAEKLGKNFIRYFFDREAGYLHAGIAPSLKKPDIGVFQNTNTIALDCIYGNYLFREILPELAAFQAQRLYHPMGHTALPFDSAAPCEMWKHVHMNQHLGHECNLARGGGFYSEIQRIMKVFLGAFENYGTAIETFNLAGCIGDEIQRTDWQTFSATGANTALVQGIGGLGWHTKGLYFESCNGNRNEDSAVEIRGFFHRMLDVTIGGKGAFASIFLDGRRLPGSLDIPRALYDDGKRHAMEVRRTNRSFSRLTLLKVPDVEMASLESGRNELSFKVLNDVHGSIRFYSPGKPESNVGRILPDSVKNVYWLDAELRAGMTVEIKCADCCWERKISS